MYDILLEMEEQFEKIKEIRVFRTPHTFVLPKWSVGSFNDESEPDHIFCELDVDYMVDSMDIKPTFLTDAMNEIGEYFRSKGFTSGPIYFDIIRFTINFKEHYRFDVLEHLDGPVKNKMRFGMVSITDLQGGHAYDFLKKEDLFEPDQDLEKWIEIRIKKVSTILKALSKGTTPDGVYYEFSDFSPYVRQDVLKYVRSEGKIKPHFISTCTIHISKEKYGEHEETITDYLKKRLEEFDIKYPIISFASY